MDQAQRQACCPCLSRLIHRPLIVHTREKSDAQSLLAHMVLV